MKRTLKRESKDLKSLRRKRWRSIGWGGRKDGEYQSAVCGARERLANRMIMGLSPLSVPAGKMRSVAPEILVKQSLAIGASPEHGISVLRG